MKCAFYTESSRLIFPRINGPIDDVCFLGNPKDSTSLHYINVHEQKQNQKQNQNQNQYVKALTAVGEICQDYDTRVPY